MRSPRCGRTGAQPLSALCTSALGAGHTSGLAENNNKIMAPNAHLGTDHTWAAPFLCERRGARLPRRGAARLGSLRGEGPTRPAVGREGGRQGITLLNAYSGAGGCHRRPVHARGEPESAALPVLPLPAGDPRAQPRGARHGAARPLPAPLRPQRVGGLGARGGGRRPPLPPLCRRRAQAAPRVPPLALEEEGAASPGGRRCRARTDPAARLAPRVPGSAVSATPERAVGRAGGRTRLEDRGFSLEEGRACPAAAFPSRLRPSLPAERRPSRVDKQQRPCE